ncbi:MAG: DUF2497 domain-containing protein [Hyphomicrobium sp.]
MTIMNGASHTNVEEILASIRTSIADEHGNTRLISAEQATTVARREPQYADEAADFELPAIFKAGHTNPVDRPKLFGRLSEALKTTAPSEPARVRTVIPFDPSAHGRGHETPVHEPATAHAGDRRYSGPSSAPPASVETSGADVKREMPTFFDTRMKRLGELTREAYEPKPPEPAPVPLAPQPPALRQPPTLPEGNLLHHAGPAVDDAAAQLLRPMLKQWLHENMPKIVEKALRSEAGLELPAPPRDPRKPGD